MPSEKRPRRRAVSGGSSTGDHSTKPGQGLRVRSSAGFVFVDPSMMSGADRKALIRITLATSLTRVWATAASVKIDVSTDRRQPHRGVGGRSCANAATNYICPDHRSDPIDDSAALRRASLREREARRRPRPWLLPQFVRDAPSVFTHFRCAGTSQRIPVSGQWLVEAGHCSSRSNWQPRLEERR